MRVVALVLAVAGSAVMVGCDNDSGRVFSREQREEFTPIVTEVRPPSARAGQQVVVVGDRFAADPGLVDLRFGDAQTVPTASSRRLLLVRVPADAAAGIVELNVTVEGLSATPVTLTVAAAPSGDARELETSFAKAPPALTNATRANFALAAQEVAP